MDQQSHSNDAELIAQLKYELQQKADVIEDQKQELYSTKKKLECMDVMKVEMEIEIEALNGLYQINGNLESTIKTQEKEIERLQIKAKMFEDQLAEKTNNEVACAELKNQICVLEKELNSRKQDDLFEIEEQLESNNCSLQDRYNSLFNDVENLRTENEQYGCKIVLLETNINGKDRELQELKDILEVKGEDLKSSLKLTKELQEEKLALTAELMTLKSNKINHNTKGNSLFAEVEDKRASTATKLDLIQKKYKELKIAFIKKNGEIKSLEIENNNLRKQWKEDNNEPYESVATLIENYKTRISELSTVVTELEKRPESPQIISISDLNNTQLNCIKQLVEYERKTNRELRTEMHQRAARETFLAEEMYDLQRKVKAMKVQMMKNVAVISELRSELECYKNSSNNSTVSGDVSMKDVINNKKEEPKNYSVPIANCAVKSVRFDETIAETSIISPTVTIMNGTANVAYTAAGFKRPSVYSRMHNVVSIKVGRESSG